MSFKQKLWAWVGAAILWGSYLLHGFFRAKDIYEAPGAALSMWERVSLMFSDITLPGALILALGTVCLLVATSDWWAPGFRDKLPAPRSGSHESSSSLTGASEMRDTWFQDAVFYVVNRRWPKDGETLTPKQQDGESFREWGARIERQPDYPLVGEALKVMRQAASDGDLSVWGRPNARKVYSIILEIVGDPLFQKVARTHWKTHEVNSRDLRFSAEQVHSVPYGAIGMDDGSVASLMVNRAQVERLWPPPAGKPSTRVTGPDMTIRELFLMIDRDAEGARRFAIGQAVRDKFSTMELWCWGRPVTGWIDRSLGTTKPLVEIPKDYWRSADLTYAFLGEFAGIAPDTANEDMHSRSSTYIDIRVNRSQAQSINWQADVSDAAKHIETLTKHVMS